PERGHVYADRGDCGPRASALRPPCTPPRSLPTRASLLQEGRGRAGGSPRRAWGTWTVGLVPKAPNTKDTCGRLGSAFDAARVVRSDSRSDVTARAVSSGSSP